MQFEGQWKNDKRQPNGRLVYHNGSWYEEHISEELIDNATGVSNPVMNSTGSRVTYTYTYQ